MMEEKEYQKSIECGYNQATLLFEQHYNDIEKLFNIYGIFDEDWKQTLRLGLWQALQKYDSTKDTKITTYLDRCIKYQLYKIYRKEYNLSNTLYTSVSIDNTTFDNGNVYSPYESIEDFSSTLDFEDVDYRLTIDEILKHKTSTWGNTERTIKESNKDKAMIRLLGDGFRYVEIGKMLNMSRQLVLKRTKRAQKLLQKYYE